MRGSTDGKARRRWPKVARSARGFSLIALWIAAWTLLVCYPNPWVLIRNGLRYARFPVEPGILDRVSFPVPTAPAAIEAVVLTHVRYEYDWRQYGVPWYVPTPDEVLATGRGDCEGRAMVLASLFAARGIPYRLQASPVHIWVDYPGKKANDLENGAVAMMERKNGRYHFRWPSMARVREDLAAQREALWDAMPPARRVALLAGWGVIVLGAWARARGRAPVPATEPSLGRQSA